MSKKDEAEAAKIVTRLRQPTAPAHIVEAIDAFLRYHYSAVERSLNDHRVLAMQYRDDRLKGVIEYQRHQVATLKTLIASNLQRAASESPTGPRARRTT